MMDLLNLLRYVRFVIFDPKPPEKRFLHIQRALTLVIYYADLATGRERQLTTGKRAERTKHDFRCPICRSAIGQASCLICPRRR